MTFNLPHFHYESEDCSFPLLVVCIIICAALIHDTIMVNCRFVIYHFFHQRKRCFFDAIRNPGYHSGYGNFSSIAAAATNRGNRETSQGTIAADGYHNKNSEQARR